ncbi:glutamate-5-semialdehyde dehydrogenase [Schaalia vaccimaxillae]|uniref:glutamate-5-semialdehyde dehydrogenase n=1 Tax=Schaalia vaccimaxillae TaxID=183916 RepID=UPI0003B7B936
MSMDLETVDISALTDAARTAARFLATASSGRKNQALEAIATAITERADEILAANAEDMARGRAEGMTDALLDRLELTQTRIRSIAGAVREVAALPDPVGQVTRGTTNELGLRITQTRVPMGVVGMIYEARPNVTIDAATLAIKSGNAVILRGGSAAEATNRVSIAVMRDALASVDFPGDLIQTVDPWGRAGANAMMMARGGIDVLIPRGSARLINAIVDNAKVPVIETGTGNCHVYVDEGADLVQAENIIMNAKTQRIGVCNAAETLLVHASVAEDFLVSAITRLTTAGVTIHADEGTRAIVGDAESIDQKFVVDATEEDWATEYLSMDLAVKVVDTIDDAIDHILTYSSGHTEAICTRSIKSANRFRSELDSAVIAINASTRFTDGGQVGLGAEIGISTQKLHARGPMGLEELTTTSWTIEGDGTIRP